MQSCSIHIVGQQLLYCEKKIIEAGKMKSKEELFIMYMQEFRLTRSLNNEEPIYKQMSLFDSETGEEIQEKIKSLMRNSKRLLERRSYGMEF